MSLSKRYTKGLIMQTSRLPTFSFLVYLLVLTGGPAPSRACILEATYLMDESHMHAGREFGGFHRIYRWNHWTYDGRRILIGSTYTGGILWDVTDPAQPLRLSNWMPWAGLDYPSTDADSLQWDFALLEDHPFGIAMHGPMGWVAFEVLPMGHLLELSRIEGSGMPFLWSNQPGALYARLFRTGGQVYAVGAWLNGEHEAVVVTTFDDPLHMQVVADLSPMEQRFDLGCPLEIAMINGTPFLMGYTGWVFGGARIFSFDLSDPTNPVVGGMPAPERIYDLHVDPEARRLYLLAAQVLYVYSLSDPLSPTLISSQDLPSRLTFLPSLAVSGNLAAIMDGNRTAVPFAWGYNIASLPGELAFDGDLGFPESKYDETNRDLSVHMTSDGDYALYRASGSIAAMTLVSGACVPAGEADAGVPDAGSPDSGVIDGSTTMPEAGPAHDSAVKDPGGDGGGCGCQKAPMGHSGGLILMLLAALLRVRSRSRAHPKTS